MDNDIEALKNKASSNSLRMAEAMEAMVIKQKEIITLLNIKNEFDERTHKSSTKINLSSLLVGCCALYIAFVVAGFDGDLVKHMYGIWDRWVYGLA